jgi:NifU-like protein involved in Fe-S cluster formation
MLDDVYNKRILELAGDIPRLGRLPHPDASATAHSKLCGSTVTVDLTLDGDRVIVGSNAQELREVRQLMQKMLKENGTPPAGKWADLAVLEPVRDYKARHASTMLTFDAVVKAIDEIEARRKTEAAE